MVARRYKAEAYFRTALPSLLNMNYREGYDSRRKTGKISGIVSLRNPLVQSQILCKDSERVASQLDKSLRWRCGDVSNLGVVGFDAV